MIREIVLDTETTGLDPKKGDRLIEIGGIEIINRIPTGVEFHRFINPERDVPLEAQKIHGITTESLIGKPVFREVVREFLAFVGDDVLVIHNAQFDINFLNHELGLLGERSSASIALLTRWRWRGVAIRPARIRSTHFASAMGSITPSARSMALWSIVFCWPRSMSNCSVSVRRRSVCKPLPSTGLARNAAPAEERSPRPAPNVCHRG
jgi:hypothetical protein